MVFWYFSFKGFCSFFLCFGLIGFTLQGLCITVCLFSWRIVSIREQAGNITGLDIRTHIHTLNHTHRQTPAPLTHTYTQRRINAQNCMLPVQQAQIFLEQTQTDISTLPICPHTHTYAQANKALHPLHPATKTLSKERGL